MTKKKIKYSKVIQYVFDHAKHQDSPLMSFKHVMYVQYVSLYYCLYYRVFPSPTISSDLRMEGCESNIVTGNPERRRERTGKQEGSGSEDVAQNMYIAW